MGRLSTLLLLVALNSVMRRLIDRWNVITLDTTADGEAVAVTDWSWVTSLPTSDFCLSVWMNPGPYVGDDCDWLYFHFEQYEFGLFRRNSKFLLYAYSDHYGLYEPGDAAPQGVWFHVVLGVTGTTAYYVYTLRPGEPVLHSYDFELKLTSTSTLLAPNIYTSRFLVRTM